MIHGGDIYSHNRKMLDFSANINPLGTSGAVKRAIAKSADTAANYPDIYCRELISKIAEYENTEPENIICSNGAAELIYNIALALKPKKALLIAPSFAEYELALKTTDTDIKYYNLDNADFELKHDYIDYIDGCDIIFICNPNNPTGKTADKALLEEIADICGKRKIYAVIDECFVNFTDNPDYNTIKSKIDENKYIIILKAFTKMYALAGIRLGYALSSNSTLLEKIALSRQPWSVSTAAQLAGIAALGETKLEEKTRKYIQRERKFLTDSFDRLNIKYIKPKANYIFFKSRPDLAVRLEKYDIMIRDCSNYKGLQRGYFRAAVRKHNENKRLIRALEEIIKNG